MANKVKAKQNERINKFLNTKQVNDLSQGEAYDIHFDIYTLKTFQNLAYSTNVRFSRDKIKLLYELFENLNVDLYKSDKIKSDIIHSIKLMTKVRIDNMTNNRNTIVTLCKNNEYGISIDFDKIEELNENEVDNACETFTNYLAYSKFVKAKNMLMKVCNDIEDNKDSASIFEYTKAFEDFILEQSSVIRQCRNENVTEKDFDTMNFKESLIAFKDKAVEQSKYLRVASQGINRLLGGGFHKQRVYVFAGSAGTGKSLFSLNMLKQMLFNNRDYEPNDETKKPMIVYLTQENSTFETTERLFSFLGYTIDDVVGMDIDEIIDLFKNSGYVFTIDGDTFNEDNGIMHFAIKYKNSNTINTDYLYTLRDTYALEGFELSCLIHDHIKCINSVNQQGDSFKDLGNIIKEYKNFAINSNIPLISITHLNRMGDTLSNKSNSNGQKSVDNLKSVNRDTISESQLIIDNTDTLVLLNSETDANGKRYMALKRVKGRNNKEIMFDYITVPMDDRGQIVEDLHLSQPNYKLSLGNEALNNLPVSVSDNNTNVNDLVGSVGPNGKVLTKDDVFGDEAPITITMEELFNQIDDDLDLEEVGIVENLDKKDD